MSRRVDAGSTLDAGDRKVWTGDHDLRPLSNLGLRQAEALAPRDFCALYARPGSRARQTLEPLKRELGIEVEVTMGVAEKQPGKHRPAMVARG